MSHCLADMRSSWKILPRLVIDSMHCKIKYDNSNSFINFLAVVFCPLDTDMLSSLKIHGDNRVIGRLKEWKNTQRCNNVVLTSSQPHHIVATSYVFLVIEAMRQWNCKTLSQSMDIVNNVVCIVLVHKAEKCLFYDYVRLGTKLGINFVSKSV